jgi:MOSC domain-containing protein YiiM
MSDRASIAQISVSAGGVPKRGVPAARVTALGLEGDAQRNRELHAGPERALCLFSLERIRALQTEGHPISAGSIGENLTLEGIDWSAVAPGACLRLGGDVVVQITCYTAPCSNITASFRDRVYARVVREGTLATGDPVRILSADEAAGLIDAR